MFLQRTHVRNMLVAVTRGIKTERFAMLWLMAYVFLLRVPSEALPMEKGKASEVPSSGQAVFYLEVSKRAYCIALKQPTCRVLCQDAKTVRLDLKSRKNRQAGSVLRRVCCCSSMPEMCPVHVLWHSFFAKLEVGERPWADVSAGDALAHLRETLRLLLVHIAKHIRHCLPPRNSQMQVDGAHLFGTHDLRRGHAKVQAALHPGILCLYIFSLSQDLQASGATLTTILAAGEWRSRVRCYCRVICMVSSATIHAGGCQVSGLVPVGMRHSIRGSHAER